MTDLLPEIRVDTGGSAGIDNLSEWAAVFPAMARRAINSALSSEGWRLKNILQRAIKDGGPDGHRWPESHPWAGMLKRVSRSGSWFNPNRRARLSAPGNPLLKFHQGVRYVLDKETSTLSTGFVNPKVKFADYLEKAATGFETPVTAKMRRLFFGIGLGLKKDTRTLESPARPLITPVFEAEEQTISRELERKFFSNMEKYMNGRRNT